MKRFHARIKIFLGSEVFQPISGILPRKLTSKIEKKKHQISKTKREYREALVHVIYSVISFHSD